MSRSGLHYTTTSSDGIQALGWDTGAGLECPIEDEEAAASSLASSP
jgi:hypothetical protein